jgi:hypothetical protein
MHIAVRGRQYEPVAQAHECSEGAHSSGVESLGADSSDVVDSADAECSGDEGGGASEQAIANKGRAAKTATKKRMNRAPGNRGTRARVAREERA